MTAKKKAATRKPAQILAYLNPEAKNKSLLDLVGKLAKRDGAEVLALSVLRDLPWYTRAAGSQSKQIRNALEHEARTALKEKTAPLVKADLKVRTRVAWGRPFEVIIREVLRKPTQLVLKTAQGDGPGESRLFGSTAMRLFRKCPVPVWAVKPRRASRIKCVLAAVDPVEPTLGEADLNVEILQWASRLAEEEGAELHVCHVFWIMGEHLLRNRMSEDDYRTYLRSVAKRVKGAMAALISDFGLALGDRRVHLLNGDPGKLIPALAEEQRADLLVMGTIARSGVSGLLIGNTAERILDTVDCSVLALKPRGFVSPIKAEARSKRV